MKQVTRNIDRGSAQDLLERVPRACLSFASDRGPQAQPVVLLWQDDRYLVGIPQKADHRPGSDQEVVLLIDEGIHFFDLRALYIRGRVTPVEAPRQGQASYIWFELVPLKIVAWDYGTLREVGNES